MTIILGNSVSCDVLSSGTIKVDSLVAQSATFSTVQVHGDSLSAVATSGDYNDLEHTPSVDGSVTENSTNLVTSGAVHAAISNVTTNTGNVYAPVHNPTFTGTVTAPVIHATTIQLNGSDVATSIAANTAKVGISQAQADAIVANTNKVGITTEQADAIVANSNKVGITTPQ
jgi:hypothetical protein